MDTTHNHHEHHEHHEHHGHHHSHHHHHHEAHLPEKMGAVYLFAVTLNLLFTAVEAAAGWWGQSMGLLSDAGHNLSDVCCLLLAMLAFRLSRTKATHRFTYGFRKTSVLISLVNAVLRLAVVVVIIVESLQKFAHPAEVSGALVTWTAAAGILINGFTAWLLSGHRKHDINTQGAFLHMLTDTLVSLGVVISGIVISVTGWNLVDPIIGLAIAAVILVSTAKLLWESVRLSVDAVPEGIHPEEILQKMKSVENVTNVHHLHIWPVSTTETALTAHVVVTEEARFAEVTASLKSLLAEEGIRHSTLELEPPSVSCPDIHCEPK